MKTMKVALFFIGLASCTTALQPTTGRRSFLIGASTIALSGPAFGQELAFSDSSSGVSWADAKVGTGPVSKDGAMVSIDYVLSTTGARYGSKIYSTQEAGAPYRWKLGDGSTIPGLEQVILGTSDIPPMRPGGVRRAVIPEKLAYSKLGETSKDCNSVGPIPPISEAFEEFQRFKNIYCNPNRAYQPDVVIDIKLYGKRTE